MTTKPTQANEEKRRAIICVKTGRPACVLLQAVLGGDRNVTMLFDSSAWLTDITGHEFRGVSGTLDEWRSHAKKINAKYGNPILRQLKESK